MKKTLALTLVLLLIVALSACKAQENNKTAKALPELDQAKPVDVQASAADMAQKVDLLIPETPATDTDTATTEPITRAQAIDLALEKAGLDRKDVFDLEAELDRERGVLLWEVEFETRSHEYSYDIDVTTGRIVRSHRERND